MPSPKSDVLIRVALSILPLVFGVACSESPAPKPESKPQPESVTYSSLPGELETPVTGAYGPLILKPGKFDLKADLPSDRPWSSWWFPYGETYLFEGGNGKPGPLQKYDEYRKKKYSVPAERSAAAYERQRLHTPGVSWAGHCHAWALAALSVPEPVKPIKNAGGTGIDFSVGDLKALVLKTFENVDVPIYGRRYFGNRSDEVFQDLYPDQFHRLIQVALEADKKPLIIDADPGFEVWNFPIYRVEGEVYANEWYPGLFHVSLRAYTADPGVAFDHVGRAPKAFDYTYDLLGKPRPDGSLEVNYGVWTEHSRNWHPDFAYLVPDNLVRGSRNEEVDPKVVDEILRR